VVERYTYSPYGNVTRYSGAWASQSETTYRNSVLFAGYWRDRDTGLLLARNRWYHPLYGRWMSRDPIGYVDGMNLYQYCGGMVPNAVDPLGLYSSAVHTRLTRDGMIARGFTPNEIKQATASNLATDTRWFLDNKRHWMLGYEGEARTHATKMIEWAAYEYANGDKSTAMFNLGQALHTAQDSASHYDDGRGSWLGHAAGVADLSQSPYIDNAEEYTDDVLSRFWDEVQEESEKAWMEEDLDNIVLPTDANTEKTKADDLL
jgi:RHS repeat-associated protein